MKFLKLTAVIAGVIVLLIALAAVYIKVALPNVGEAPDIQIERTPERIERGKYLATHVALCMDCHSTRDWSLYSGPMAPGGLGSGGEIFGKEMGFPGTYYAKNITPYHLGDWTDGEILRAVTTGVNKDGKPLFPIMGYERFGRMDQEDVYSIIAYIRTLEPVHKDIPESEPEFPLNFLLHTMPQPASFSVKPPESDRLKYGAYLVNVAGCVECHSQTEKGRVVPGTEFGGGFAFPMPSGIVRSVNITPDPETGIGSWSMEDFVQRFKSYGDSSYVPQQLGPDEFNTPMPWVMYSGMTRSDLEAIYSYLFSLEPKKHKVEKWEKLP